MQLAHSTVAVVLLLSGCFHPPDNAPLKCNVENPCPDEMACIGGLCSASSVDGAGQAVDMLDGFSPSSEGCAAKDGAVVGAKAEACAGTCIAGQCGSLCGQGWHVCKDAAGIDLALLKVLDGFFIADVPGYFYDPIRMQVSCGPAVSPARPIFFGGGKSQADVTDSPAKPCSAFTQSADCGSTSLGLQCAAPFTLAQVAITNSNNGVLCCKP